MVEIIIYNNGFEVKGHSPDKGICGEVCLAAWIVANELSHDGINVRRYASIEDNPDNPHEGITWVILDKNCEKSMHQLELYKYNLQRWKHNWEGHVSITEIYADLIK
jgi:hypothetical protein